MNRSIIRRVLGRLCQIQSLLLLVPLLVGLIYGDGRQVYLAYGLSAIIAFAFGSILAFQPPERERFYTKEGLVTVALIWIVYSGIGALPFVLSGEIPNYIDAYFEMASGFTTTGASILENVEALSQASLFWRSFSHLIGGMGVLVLALAVLPNLGADSIHLMRAEVPGPSFGKTNTTIRSTAKRLYIIYLGMTAILILILMLAGLNLFDAIIHAFGAAGTGGFSNYSASVGHFQSLPVEIILSVAMIAFGINFNIYHYLLLTKGKGKIKSEESLWYFSFIGLATLAMTINILPSYLDQGLSLGRALRHTFFTSSSIITTTGYGTADFASWPLFSRMIILLLMFTGASAGSTGGGLKVSRVAMLMKSAVQGVRASREPSRALPLRFEYQAVSREKLRELFHYLLVYIGIYIACLLIVSLDQVNFLEANSAVAACFNNIGPGFDQLGPRGNFAFLSPLSKVTLSFAMIAGRLEIYPVLMLFALPSRRKAKTK